MEGKKRGRRGREGLTRAITLLETLVMQVRHNIKCFFSLILSFGHGGKFSLNFPDNKARFKRQISQMTNLMTMHTRNVMFPFKRIRFATHF